MQVFGIILRNNNVIYLIKNNKQKLYLHILNQTKKILIYNWDFVRVFVRILIIHFAT
jgi:hypothetical protein